MFERSALAQLKEWASRDSRIEARRNRPNLKRSTATKYSDLSGTHAGYKLV